MSAAGHEILEGINGFAMAEEPYRFKLDPLGETTILLEYDHERINWQVAWVHRFGFGRVWRCGAEYEG